jgi:multiple antibiotic resistance protein
VQPLLKSFLVAFIPLFVAMDPLGMVPIYLGLAQGTPRERRNVVVYEAVGTALLIAVGFLFLGRFIFQSLGITNSDFQIAGGLILFGIAAQDILFSDPKNTEGRRDFGVVPLGMPLIAGPAMLTSILALVETAGVVMTLIALLINLVLMLIALRTATPLEKLLGLRGMRAFSKIVALLLAAIAVNLVRRGLQTAL